MSQAIRPTVSLIGTGKLARTLAPLIVDAGYPLRAVCGRRASSARAVCRGLRGVSATTDQSAAARAANLLLLAVSDDALKPLATVLSRTGVDWNGRVVLHHAGALGIEPLRALQRAGAATGVLHPLQCIGDAERARRLLVGSRARIEGLPRARRTALRLARDLGLVPLRPARTLRPAERGAYHAAASLVSNDLLALLGMGLDLFESIGYGRREALAALEALARGTLSQAAEAGLHTALTGPVIRGDAATLETHLRRLGARSPEDAEIHRLLSRRLLRLAERGATGTPRADRRKVASLLSRPTGRRSRPTV